LAVDDNPLGLQVAQLQLQRLGAQVCGADSGSKALDALLTGEAPDIVLVDLHMPGLDGFATVHRMREIDGMRDVPVIALSASVDPQDPVKAEHATMTGFIRKPFTLESLATGVLEAAAQRRQSPDERLP
jgi:CheY-like chemotaxis protein